MPALKLLRKIIGWLAAALVLVGIGLWARQFWPHGGHVTEAAELLITFALFTATLLLVYYVQRWIGDY